MTLTEIHSGSEAFLTRVRHIDADGIVLERSPARTAVGRHLWLELVLASGADPIRVLAEVVGRNPQTTRVRVKHVWPRDRHGWEQLTLQAEAA